MKTKSYRDVPLEKVEEAPGVGVRWVLSKKDATPNFSLRVFELAPGASTPHHAHPWEHEVFILEGEGVAKSAEGEKKLSPGEVALVMPDEVHSFTNTSKNTWRFICLIPNPK